MAEKSYGDQEGRKQVWEDIAPLLEPRGYEIAWHGDTRTSKEPQLPPARDPFCPQPGESLTAATLGVDGVRWGGPSFWTSLACAYDKEGRTVVLKIIPTASSELAILKTLDADRSSPENHTIPLLECIEAGEWTIIAMPAWELTLASCHPCWCPKDYLNCARQCLEGLAYMHKKRIAHLDIYGLNIVVNHVCHCRGNKNRNFFSEFDARMGIIDFGCSVQLEDTAQLIPVEKAPQTYSTIPGVITESRVFNPFAADVCALARALRSQMESDRGWCKKVWKTVCPADRLSAEAGGYLTLLEDMMLPDPNRRPTAKEALERLKDLIDDLPPSAMRGED